MNPDRPRSGFWSAVRDFMQDNNGTREIYVRTGDWMPAVVGSCGLHPDEAAMRREPVSRFDMIADEMGWDCATRKLEYWIYERIGAVARLGWLRNQVEESLKTDSAPLGEMTPEEQSWFLREISARKKASAKRRTQPAIENPTANEPSIEQQVADWNARAEREAKLSLE